MKKRICVFISVFLLFVSLSPSAFADELENEQVTVSAKAAALYCVESGAFVFEKNADERLPMASTTKIMSALLTLEDAEKLNRTVVFCDNMTAEGSSMYLKLGEKVTLDDLAVGMLMQSGNDAANAAAICVAGSIPAFSSKMNDRASRIGMKHTHFVTPSGLDDDDHYSTARDMALLMADAMKNARFRAITKNRSMNVTFLYPKGKTVTYRNHNRLMSLYPSCIGGKTGFTKKSGRCLVSVAQKNGLTFIAVTLNAPDDWNDHIKLYDHAFSAYTRYDVKKQVSKLRLNVVGAAADACEVVLKDERPLVVKQGESHSISVTALLPPFCYAPVKRGEQVGLLLIRQGEKTMKIPLLSARTIEREETKRNWFEKLKELLVWHNRYDSKKCSPTAASRQEEKARP